MADTATLHRPDAAEIRARRAEDPKTRARDFAENLGISEAELVAAHLGAGVTAIDPTPAKLFPLLRDLGDVMGLTRNDSCVHERIGVYEPYHDGPHAAMVLGPEIDLRIFPKHWVYGFALEEETPEGGKRSLQIFDAAGDAVHKIHLKPASDVAAFGRLVEALRLAEPPVLAIEPRAETAPAKGDPARADELRAEWAKMTDTHQFLPMVQKLKMNRLGANRLVGAPHARKLSTDAVTLALEAAARDAIPIMVFVGNMGCIQIHGGPVEKIVPMGPWINVMDPRFNLHLRADHIAEVWCVTKATRTGDAISVEGFDDKGGLILQLFAYRKDNDGAAWKALTEALPEAEA